MDPNKTLRTIMTTNLRTIQENTNMEEVQSIFKVYDFHHLPVLNEEQKLCGIISREDLSKLNYYLSLVTTGKTYTKLEYSSLKAKDIMTPNPLCLYPDDTIGLAADIFLANKFHAVPIVEDDQLVGIVTTHDLLNYGYSSPISEIVVY
ncbi:MAG: CBS domain-containing protein [Saprospiraceae bacterium]|nr:CBS domain-containing protein [Saprospiraceae bacterium]